MRCSDVHCTCSIIILVKMSFRQCEKCTPGNRFYLRRKQIERERSKRALNYRSECIIIFCSVQRFHLSRSVARLLRRPPRRRGAPHLPPAFGALSGIAAMILSSSTDDFMHRTHRLPFSLLSSSAIVKTYACTIPGQNPLSRPANNNNNTARRRTILRFVAASSVARLTLAHKMSLPLSSFTPSAASSLRAVLRF